MLLQIRRKTEILTRIRVRAPPGSLYIRLTHWITKPWSGYKSKPNFVSTRIRIQNNDPERPEHGRIELQPRKGNHSTTRIIEALRQVPVCGIPLLCSTCWVKFTPPLFRFTPPLRLTLFWGAYPRVLATSRIFFFTPFKEEPCSRKPKHFHSRSFFVAPSFSLELRLLLIWNVSGSLQSRKIPISRGHQRLSPIWEGKKATLNCETIHWNRLQKKSKALLLNSVADPNHFDTNPEPTICIWSGSRTLLFWTGNVP
jgi:hypothetical protein